MTQIQGTQLTSYIVDYENPFLSQLVVLAFPPWKLYRRNNTSNDLAIYRLVLTNWSGTPVDKPNTCTGMYSMEAVWSWYVKLWTTNSWRRAGEIRSINEGASWKGCGRHPLSRCCSQPRLGLSLLIWGCWSSDDGVVGAQGSVSGRCITAIQAPQPAVCGCWKVGGSEQHCFMYVYTVKQQCWQHCCLTVYTYMTVYQSCLTVYTYMTVYQSCLTVYTYMTVYQDCLTVYTYMTVYQYCLTVNTYMTVYQYCLTVYTYMTVYQYCLTVNTYMTVYQYCLTVYTYMTVPALFDCVHASEAASSL